MAFLGKEFKFVKDENFEGYLKAVGLPEDEIAKTVQYKPTIKLEKDGDTYIFSNITPAKTKVVRFKSGEEMEEEIREGHPVKTIYTVDGNTITQVIKRDGGKESILKREYSDNALKVTITSNSWDGVAYRYYVA